MPGIHLHSFTSQHVISSRFPHTEREPQRLHSSAGTSTTPNTAAVLEKPRASTSSPGHREEDFDRVHQGSRSSPLRSASSQHSPSPTRSARYALPVLPRQHAARLVLRKSKREGSRIRPASTRASHGKPGTPYNDLHRQEGTYFRDVSLNTGSFIANNSRYPKV